MAITTASCLRLATWVGVVLLAVLSLLPAEEMARTSLGGHVEHAIAYAGTAMVMQLGYPGQSGGRQVLMLIAYAGCLEFLQHFSPGRTPAVEDWLFSSVGVLGGAFVGRWLAGALSMGRRSSAD